MGINEHRDHVHVKDHIVILGANKIYLIDKGNGSINSYSLEGENFGFHFHNVKDGIVLLRSFDWDESGKHTKVKFAIFDTSKRRVEYKEAPFVNDYSHFFYDFPMFWAISEEEIACFNEEGQKILSFKTPREEEQEEKNHITRF